MKSISAETEQKQQEIPLMKYKQNLRIEGDRVISYSTHVATIQGGKLLVHGYWSMTTSKHVNHVANELGLEKVNAPKDTETKDNGDAHLKTVAGVAALAAIFTSNQKESNDWKARMIKAGLSGHGLIMPDDWDTLSEDEKTKRLDKALAVISHDNEPALASCRARGTLPVKGGAL